MKLLSYIQAAHNAVKVLLLLMVAGALFAGGLWLARWSASLGDVHVAQLVTRGAEVATVRAPLVETGRVPYARLDGPPFGFGDTLSIEELELRDASDVRGGLFIQGGSGNPEGTVVVIRQRDVWFPEWRSPGAEIDVEAGPLSPSDSNGPRVTFTPKPRALIGFDPGLTVGTGVLPGTRMDGSLWIGADLVRIGPAHLGAGAATMDPDHPGNLTGLPVDLGPSLSTRVRGDLYLTGGYLLMGDQLFLGVTYKF